MYVYVDDNENCSFLLLLKSKTQCDLDLCVPDVLYEPAKSEVWRSWP